MIYINDIIVYRRPGEEHVKHRNLVIQRLSAANLRLKPSKCHFAQTEFIR